MKTKKIIEDISKAMIELMETDKGHWNSGLKDYISTGIPYNKFTGIRYVGLNTLIPVSYTHLTLPTNREV